MPDEENKTSEQLAAEINSPQIEQVDVTEETSQSPDDAPSTSDELILGKFKTQDDLVKGYQELERNYTASRQARTTPQPQPAVIPSEVFDTDTVTGIKSIFEAELERKKVEDFARKYKDDLADPLLRGAVLVEIQEANARGEYLDQESALENAKRALETRLTPKVAAASKESFDEGKDISRRKEQAGAVGGTNAASPKVDPDSLSAAEYAEYMGLERV